MDTQTIIRKYGLRPTEKNGKKGVQPTAGGKITAADMEYIKAHGAEIIAMLDSWTKQQEPVRFTDGEIARRTVDELEGKYRRLERDGDTSAAIAARNAWDKALAEWQRRFPTEAAKSSAIRYNDGATNNPWTI